MTFRSPFTHALSARRQWLQGGVAAGLVLGLTGCGFRLRGALSLPFTSLRTNLNLQTPLGQELLAQLKSSGVRVFSPSSEVLPGQVPEVVDVVLDVLINQRERAVVGKTATGQVRELQLRHRFKFRVRTPSGRDLIDDVELLQERDLSYSEDLALGKEMEEGLLYRDMQSDVVRQVMRRLAAIKGL